MLQKTERIIKKVYFFFTTKIDFHLMICFRKLFLPFLYLQLIFPVKYYDLLQKKKKKYFRIRLKQEFVVGYQIQAKKEIIVSMEVDQHCSTLLVKTLDLTTNKEIK